MPVAARRWSLGFYILLSTMVGTFALIMGLMLKPDWLLGGFVSLPRVVSSVGDNLNHGLEYLRLGQFSDAREEFEKCDLPICRFHVMELDFVAFGGGSEFFRNSATIDGNLDSQYMLSVLLSNEFLNITEYTSKSFGEGVLYLYAASTGSHPGALMAMGYRHLHGYGVPKRCETAALNYLEVAKPVANIYANSIPRAVELIRLNVEHDKKILSISEISLFTEVAHTSPEIALAVGKRFLLGTDGFPQDYTQGIRFLSMAANIGDDAAAWALLGYVHALGLGVDTNTEIAEEFFEKGIQDGLGMNGLGFLRFKQEQFVESFALFNQSATVSGSADGMFNLASLYLTGTGTVQNFQKAFMWFTEALRRGHTPAGYALAVMHLNGIGTVRDCSIAVSLLKEVAERGEWLAALLRTAHSLMALGETELAAVQLLKLAEAGHQVSQDNLAHLIESEQVGNRLFGKTTLEFKHIYAQRFYELAAAQGSVAAQLRLGDYAFDGKGIDSELVELDEDVVVLHHYRTNDPHRAFELYQKTLTDANKVATLTGANTPQWLTRIVATAEFNLGYQHHFGIGVRPNLYHASKHYRKAVPDNIHGKSIWLWLIDTFVYPAVTQEALTDESAADQPDTHAAHETPTDDTPTDETSTDESSTQEGSVQDSFAYYTNSVFKVIRNYRVILLMVLVWVLLILIYLKI